MRAPGKIAARAPETGGGNPKLPEFGVSSAVRKAFNEALHPRDANGRFKVSGNAKPRGGKGGNGQRKELVGQERLKTSGVAGDDTIEVLSKRVRKYQGATTVEQFVANHPKGRAYALRVLAADHKAGRIGFKAAEKPAEAAGTGRAALTTTVAIDPKLADGSFRANTERVDSGLKGDDFLISLNGSKRYPMGITVDQAAEAHPKGKVAGLKQIAADMKAGRLQAERLRSARAPVAKTPIKKPIAIGEISKEVSFGSGTTSDYQARYSEGIYRVPEGIRNKLKQFGVVFQAPSKSSDFDKEFAAVQVRGASAGRTTETADGYYSPSSKTIVVPQNIYSISAHKYYDLQGQSDTVTHEIGHAIDHMLGYSSSRGDYLNAYREDVAAYRASGGNAAKYQYYLQPGDNGPSEMFAEQFSKHMRGNPDKPSGILRDFPKTAEYLATVIRGLS